MAIKIGLGEAPPLYASGFRFLIAAGVIWPLILLRRSPLPRSWPEFLRRGLPGFFMFGSSYAMVYVAEQHISSALTAVLFASFSFFVALFSLWLVRSEPLSPRAWLGMALGLAGIILISYDSFGVSDSLFWGVILALGGSLTSAFGTVLHKRWFAADDILVSAGTQILFGLVPLLVAAMIFENLADFKTTTESIGSLLYLSILGTVVAFLGYYWLLARLRVVVVSSIVYVTPVLAILIGALGFEESLRVVEIGGMTLVLAGVVLVTRK
jgi:drug/metabolite transporter (DMT)-like permease